MRSHRTVRSMTCPQSCQILRPEVPMMKTKHNKNKDERKLRPSETGSQVLLTSLDAKNALTVTSHNVRKERVNERMMKEMENERK